MDVSFIDIVEDLTGVQADALVVGVFAAAEGGDAGAPDLSVSAAALDAATGGMIGRALGASPRYTAKSGETLAIPAPGGLEARTLILVGLGDARKLAALAWQKVGGALAQALDARGVGQAVIALDPVDGADISAAAAAASFGYGVLLGGYRFDKYRTKLKPEQKPALTALTVATSEPSAAQDAFEEFVGVARGVALTRDLVSEPANILHPESFADRCRALAGDGVAVDILGEAQMADLGMRALLGVGQGSARESKLVVMRWQGGEADDAPLAVVGKGVTFDTGGISIKPSAGMWDMKWDMGGAGVVTGLMRALAGRKAPVNVVGVIGLVENMPDGNAQRPGDIVTSMSGQTIEVWNTDAEGRLVLADALWYAQETYKPKAVIDLATLTGAMIVALGEHQAGVFANDDELAQGLLAAGEVVGEPVWRMPLGEPYHREIDSQIADMKNISGQRWGGACVAAAFLERFIQPGTVWAHLDIAGVTFAAKDRPLVPKGATAFGVRLLDQLVRDRFEG